MLDDERNDVYLHVDARAVELFNQFKDFQLKKGKLIILKNRIAVHWGDLSQVEVEYRLFETALYNGPYAYYHLLSGVDLPIKTQDYIHEFFQKHAGKFFLAAAPKIKLFLKSSLSWTPWSFHTIFIGKLTFSTAFFISRVLGAAPSAVNFASPLWIEECVFSIGKNSFLHWNPF